VEKNEQSARKIVRKKAPMGTSLCMVLQGDYLKGKKIISLKKGYTKSVKNGESSEMDPGS